MSEQIETTMQELFAKIIDYYSASDPTLSEQVADAFFDVVDPRQSLSDEEFERLIGLLNEWFVFDFELESGLTPLWEYLRENPEGLESAQLELLEQVASTQFSSDFWLLEARPDEGLLVLMPFHEEVEYLVADSRASTEMAGMKGALGLRVVCVDGQWLPAGTGIYYVDTVPTDELREMVRAYEGVAAMPFIELVKENYGPDADIAVSGYGATNAGSVVTTPERLQIEYEVVCGKAGIKVSWEELCDRIYNATTADNPYNMIKEIFYKGIPDKATFFTLFDILIRAWNVLPKKNL